MKKRVLSNPVPRRLRRTAVVLLAPVAVVAAQLGAATSSFASPTANERAATGRIEGTVLLSNAVTVRRPRFRIYADPGPGSRPPAIELNEMRNVVLYVQRVDGTGGAPSPRATMAQADEQFRPHVLPVQRGTTVDFPNADEVYHNVFSLSSAKTFDLGRFPKGASKSVLFEKAGTVQVFCHIHSDMSAVVLVLDNPYFATPATSGRYVIEDVPAGEYTVVGWHERIKPVMRTVRVVAGATAKLDFNIPIPPGEDGAH